MEHALKAVAIETAKGLGFLAGSICIFALVAMLMYHLSASLARENRFKTALQYAFPQHIWAKPSAQVDLWLMVIRTFIIGPTIALIVTLVAGTGVAQLLVEYVGRPPVTIGGAFALAIQFVVSILAGELGFYAYHRLTHANRFFWTAHRVHHSAEEMTFLTGGRDHPLDDVGILVSGLLIASPLNGVGLYFTGVEPHHLFPVLLLAYSLFASVEDKFNHSHVPVSFGPLNYIFLSGHMHQIHHSAELRHRDKNFGATMSLYDWLFGTIYIPARGENPVLGLAEDSLGENNPHQSVRDCLVEPFKYLRSQFRAGTSDL